MSEGRLRVQLPQVKTQKFTSTTRPRRSARRSGRSPVVLSQDSFVSSGAPSPTSGKGAGRVSPEAIVSIASAVKATNEDAVCIEVSKIRRDGAPRMDGHGQADPLGSRQRVVTPTRRKGHAHVASRGALSSPRRVRRAGTGFRVAGQP